MGPTRRAENVALAVVGVLLSLGIAAAITYTVVARVHAAEVRTLVLKHKAERDDLTAKVADLEAVLREMGRQLQVMKEKELEVDATQIAAVTSTQVPAVSPTATVTDTAAPTPSLTPAPTGTPFPAATSGPEPTLIATATAAPVLATTGSGPFDNLPVVLVLAGAVLVFSGNTILWWKLFLPSVRQKR